jgi:hypothetical protein
VQSERNESKKRRSTGIDERHSRGCRSREGGKCNCNPSYRAWVYDARSSQKIQADVPDPGRGQIVACRRAQRAAAWAAGTNDPADTARVGGGVA